MKAHALRQQRGSVMVEALISMALLTVGMLGLISAEIAARHADGQGLKVSQASALAQRTLQSLELLDWNDARLADSLAENDADIADSAKAFEAEVPAVIADHQLQVPGLAAAISANALRTLNGFAATDTLDYYNDDDRPDFDVYWNVADCSVDANWNFNCDAPGSVSVKRIGVVVRFHQGGRWLRVASQSAIFNPSNLGE